MRRIGVLMGYAENDPETKARIAAFLQEMQQLGWTDGRNLKLSIDGKRAIFAKLHWNWWHTSRTSSLLAPPQLWPPCSR